MPRKSILSTPEIVTIVERHGLAETILDYVSSDQVEDPVLADAWEQAVMILEQIKEALDTTEPLEDAEEEEY